MSEADGERALAAAFLGGMEPECKGAGCWKDATVRGYCRKHYQRARAAGEFGGKPCYEWPCEGVAVSRGLCTKHYNEAHAAGKLPEVAVVSELCVGEEGCYREVKAKGMCMTHYMRARRAK